MMSYSAHDDGHAGHAHGHAHGHPRIGQSHAQHGCSEHDHAAPWKHSGKGTHGNNCPRRADGRRRRFADASCPVCSVMMTLSAVLLISSSPLVSCAEHGPTVPCGGHGVLHGDHCDCDPGFKRDASELNCVASSGASDEAHESHDLHSRSDSWVFQLTTNGDTASEHIWSLMGAEDYQTPVGVDDIQSMMDMAEGVYAPPPEPECAGKGHLHGGSCHCNSGYMKDPSDSMNCVPVDECAGKGHLHGGSCHCSKGYMTDPGDSTNCVPITDDQDVHDEDHDEDHKEHIDEDIHEGHDHDEDHGEDHEIEEHHEEEYGLEEHEGEAEHHDEDHEEDQIPSRRRLAQDICGGHGHPHDGKCHCNDGYITDPSDSGNCITESSASAGTGDTQWTLRANEIMAVAGGSSDGLLHFENLSEALPLIVSCQMDPTCSLDTTPPAVPPPEGPKESEVELWMALVAAASLAVIPMLAMALPVVVFNSFSGRQMDIFVSLGNCLSAGLIFSLGIMHIIPDTVEALYMTGVSYPLNYLLIVVGFFVTLFLEVVVGGQHEVIVEETEDNTAGEVICRRRSSITGPTGAIAGSLSKEQRAKIQELSGSPRLDLKDEAIMEESSVAISCRDDESVEEEEGPKGGRKPFGDVVQAILPVILFFVAIQFHACLECIVIGVQTSLENFWTLFAGICIHKAFVSFAFGVKLHRSSKNGTGHYWYLVIMAGLWALLPALCVLLGYLLSDGMHPMAKLVFASLAGGTFIYIGSFEILGEEFEHHHKPQGNGQDTKDSKSMPNAWGVKTSDRLIKFAALALGVALVAALSAIPHKHD